ncbi:MAG: error-prone DNA polymerase [Pseudomonadota bacterium]
MALPAHLPAHLPAYAELHCRSNFSFLTGASHPGELVQRAKALGYSALAITDECSVAGVVRAHEEAVAQQLPLIIGAEMRLTRLPVDDKAPPVPDMRLVLLATTRRGYGNLSLWITVARRRAGKGEYRAHRTDVEGKVPEAPMLAGLPECRALLVPDAAQPFETVFEQAQWLKQWFPEGRAGLALELLDRPHDAVLKETVRRVAQHTGLPIVAAGDVLMHVRSRKPLQDTLTAIRSKRTVADCGEALQPNAEQHLRSRARLAQLYEPEWLENTLAWAGACRFSLQELKYEYPQELVPPGHTPTTWLRRLTEEGLVKRYPKGEPPEVRKTVEKELALIAQLRYEPFFLTVADIVQWARAQNILCQGRGSAANSVVCYSLGITEVNPDRVKNLLFERFISAERDEPPDIDVDFEHQRREEVIQYIYGKYSRHRTALAAVVISYRPRSALRDVGKALGLDEDRIAMVAKGQHWFDGRHIADERLIEAGLDPQAPIVKLWMALTLQLIGMPRHLSQHPGGFVIAKDNVAHLVPVENCAMDNRTVIQWDKDDLESLGLLKVDVLALGMLSALRRAFDLLALKLQRPFGMPDVPQGDDPATYQMLSRADTVGVFQVESRAQMSMLPRLKPREYYDLVVQVAIVRPGPIQGGMVHPYLTNREKAERGEPIEYPSDEIRPALERTMGVPIFQEQVMQIAMYAADFTGGEADQLRRAMAAWKRKGGLGPFGEKLIGRMVAKGYALEYAQRIFEQIKGFGEYGFPESHAASFALLAYASAWLKCHHPDAFLAALLNSQPMGFYAPAQLVRDAREHGVQVRPVDVRFSEWESGLEELSTTGSEALHPVRLGFSRINGFGEEAAKRIVQARAERDFDTPEDLARRARLDARDMRLLAEADALQGLTGHRHQAAWHVAGIDTRPTAMLQQTRTQEAQVTLAAPAPADETLADYRAVGLTLKTHPMALLREQLKAFRVEPAVVLRTYRSGQLARASGIVTHRQQPQTANGTIFVTLEDETGQVNVIVWPRVVQSQRKPLLAARVMTVYGVWQSEKGVQHLVASKLVDHSALLQGLSSKSRDFR